MTAPTTRRPERGPLFWSLTAQERAAADRMTTAQRLAFYRAVVGRMEQIAYAPLETGREG